MLGEDIDIGVVSPGLIRRILGRLEPLVAEQARVQVGIMGESGSGKTVLAHALQKAAHDRGHRAVVIQLDDYFRLPPRDNDARRRADLSWVGPGEIDWERLERDLARIAAGARSIEKPLVDFPNNTISQETLDLEAVRLVLVEGTYVGMLQRLDFRIFIDRTYEDTREARRTRAREPQDAWLDSVLAIEQRHIRPQMRRADVIVAADE